MKDQPQCGNCRFWKRLELDDDENDDGFCHRYAPHPALILQDEYNGMKDFLPVWPLTYAFQVCGDHQSQVVSPNHSPN